MEEKRLLWCLKTSAQGRDHTLGNQSKPLRHQLEQQLWKQIIILLISVMETVTT